LLHGLVISLSVYLQAHWDGPCEGN
jgi:hypothetical protein